MSTESKGGSDEEESNSSPNVPGVSNKDVDEKDTPEKVVTTQSIAPSMNTLSVPWDFKGGFDTMTDILMNEKFSHFATQFKDAYRIKLGVFGKTFDSIIEAYFKHYRFFDVLFMDDIETQPNRFSPGDRFWTHDPMGVGSVIPKLKTTRYVTFNPVFEAGASDSITMDDDGEEFIGLEGKGDLEVGFQSDVYLNEYEQVCYEYFHATNFSQLGRIDYIRQYMRQMDDEFTFTDSKPFDEDRTFTYYWLPEITPNQYISIMDTTPLLFPDLWTESLTSIQRHLQVSTFPQSEVFRKLVNALEVQTNQFNMKNSFASSINPGRAEAFVKKLLTLLYQNRFFVFEYQIHVEEFDLVTLMECIAAKMLPPEIVTGKHQSKHHLDSHKTLN